ncbi:MAG: hypothetical protein LUG13_02725 [Oscillospiraceae bacterium]|nr:hypothetical protein [Oscillospiraceae bacterium]
MASMVEFVKSVVKRMIAEDYPHAVQPPVVYARITAAADAGEYNEYTLVALTKFGDVDDDFPALPGVRSKNGYDVGITVLVALPYGELPPQIINEVIL